MIILLACILTVVADMPAAAPARIETALLPALRIDGQNARAHTQGLEVIGNEYYVTARLEQVPRKALLLRTSVGATDWEVWDITPRQTDGAPTAMDHPGGLQSDGKHLWIPLAESVPGGCSRIQVYPLDRFVPGVAAVPEFEFAVDDHIGALAVSAGQERVFGASWDTAAVYIWDFVGQLRRTLTGDDLRARRLGIVNTTPRDAGVAVQDWKVAGKFLFGSGLVAEPSAEGKARSRLIIWEHFLETTPEVVIHPLPWGENRELAREGMALSEGWVYFLPEDLSGTNYLYKTPLGRFLGR